MINTVKIPSLPFILALFFSAAFSEAQSSYLGFDRNAYPGDANLKALHQTFSYTGYWLNNPPGERTNTWAGHRDAVEAAGFGFLVLFNGRVYAELKSVANARKLGASDAQAPSVPHAAKAFPRTPSSSSTRSKADACCPSRKPTSTPGLTALPPPDSAPASTA